MIVVYMKYTVAFFSEKIVSKEKICLCVGFVLVLIYIYEAAENSIYKLKHLGRQ